MYSAGIDSAVCNERTCGPETLLDNGPGKTDAKTTAFHHRDEAATTEVGVTADISERPRIDRILATPIGLSYCFSKALRARSPASLKR